jgi:hypothetical protein
VITSGVESRQLYLGLSTDTKPGGAEFAARFYEYDTGKTYLWTGAPAAPAQGQWIEYLPLYPVAFDFANPQR